MSMSAKAIRSSSSMATQRRHISGATSFPISCRSDAASPPISSAWAIPAMRPTAPTASSITAATSAPGFSWAERHPERIKALVYMEAIVRPFLSWDEWPEATREFFKGQRSPAGEDLILQKNLFIEYLLPLRGLSREAMEVYRRPYRNTGPSRLPMLAWSRDLPIE